MNLTRTLAILLGSFIATSHGYYLDQSCDQYRDVVITGMQSAFDLAHAGSDLLDHLIPSGSGATWQAQKDLVEFMFAAALTNGNPDPSNTNWRTVSNVFTSVLTYNSNGGQPDPNPNPPPPGSSIYDSLHPSDLVIYCDYSRFIENKDCLNNPKPGYTCDTTILSFWKMDNIYTDCKSKSILNMSPPAAWTMRYTQNRLPSQMQICPWFLEETKKNKVLALAGQGKAASLARSWKKFSGWMDDPLRTPMDVAATFDHTLLHEMTHAIPADATVDSGGGMSSYGWKSCVKLATKNGKLDPSDPNGPEVNLGVNNADSYGYFGLAARMISPTNGGKAQRPMSDGSIKVLPAAAGSSKRDRLDLALIDDPTVPRSLGDPAGFLASVPSMTTSIGQEYTIASNVFCANVATSDSSDVIYDHCTVFKSSVGGSSVSSLGKISISSGPTTFSTLIRGNSSSSGIILPLSTGSGLPSDSGSTKGSASNSGASLSGKASISDFATSNKGGSTKQTATGIISSSDAPSSSTEASNTRGQSAVTTVTSGGSATLLTLPPSDITSPPSTSSTGTAIAILPINWGTVTPTKTSGVTKATHDSHGWPIIPALHCWFCPRSGGGINIGFLIPGIKGPGIIPPPPPGVKPPPGFSINMPSITLDPEGDPSYDTASPISQPTNPASSANTESKRSGSSSSCSTHTISACDTSFSIFTPSGAKTASTSTITLSCSTVTACSASLTGSSTTDNGPLTVTPIADNFLAWDAAAPSWYDSQQSIISEAMADTTDPYVTWSSNEIYVSYNPSSTDSFNSSRSASTTSSSTGSHSASPSTKPSGLASATTTRSLSSGSGPSSTTRPFSISSSPPITSCSMIKVAATTLGSFSYAATSICTCNDGWGAGIGSTVGPDKSTTYTCEVGTTLTIAVSTAGPPPPTTTASTTPTPTIPAPTPLASCHTQYKLVLDSFDIYGFDWDESKLDAGGSYLHGNGLLEQLRGCSAITRWKFENLTLSDTQPYEWHASGQSTIWQKKCIEHAMLSAGAPSDSCSGSG